MTNKEAQITINAIKFMLDHAQYSDDVEEALNMAISALTEQQWIPVTERLPEKECFALVTVNDGAIYTDFSLFRKDGRFIEHTGDVIAWMPLPEPYREDKE